MVHLTALKGYGYHADEIYYVELGKQWQWGFPDISPFVTWMARISNLLFGSSLTGYRILPCFFSAATVVITGYITHFLGGKRLAITIACSAIICSPAFLATSYLLQPAVFDEFFWTLLSFAFIAYHKSRKTFYLWLMAVALAFGILNKYSILLLVFSAFLAWLVFGQRTYITNWKKYLLPALVFVLILAPHLAWQIEHGFPVLNFTAVVAKTNFEVDPGDYILQLFFFHGASVAVWSAGLIFLMTNPKSRAYFFLGIASLVVIVVLSVLKGKLYYGLGLFPLLFANGGHCWELMLIRFKSACSVVFISMLYTFALLSLPVVIPIFSVTDNQFYMSEMVRLTGFSRPLRYEDGTYGKMPQFFADMTDWEYLTSKLENASKQTETSGKARLILTNDYAIAGALKHYGDAALPLVISAKNSFLTQSPKNLDQHTIIYLTKLTGPNIHLIADQVRLMDTIRSKNSHINGLRIYKLSFPSQAFKQQYARDRLLFIQK
ncbi:glycosyltransferase family 39 protein [uncultured Pedobacter sp.]|uniref:ArnT family glycosyltransferase n=1 Tax=uncultured Pedobacter sp. TaxID=246139 RepID=UPI0025DB8620|nr:glycosyltransferase family 39 protein [uncultured Pedobacter sp.]